MRPDSRFLAVIGAAILWLWSLTAVAAAASVIPQNRDFDFIELKRTAEYLARKVPLECIDTKQCIEPRCESAAAITSALLEARTLLPKMRPALKVYQRAVFDRYISQLESSKITGAQRARALHAQFVQDTIYGIAKITMDAISFHEFITDFKGKSAEYLKPDSPALKAMRSRLAKLTRHVHDMADRTAKARGYVRKSGLFENPKGVAKLLETRVGYLNDAVKALRRGTDALKYFEEAKALRAAGKFKDALKRASKGRVNLLKIGFSVAEVFLKMDKAARGKRIKRDAEIQRAEDDNARKMFEENVRVNRRLQSLDAAYLAAYRLRRPITICAHNMCGDLKIKTPPKDPVFGLRPGRAEPTYASAVEKLTYYNARLADVNARLIDYRERFKVVLGAKPQLTLGAKSYAPKQTVQAEYALPRCIPKGAHWDLHKKGPVARKGLASFPVTDRPRASFTFTAPEELGKYQLVLKTDDPYKLHGISPFEVTGQRRTCDFGRGEEECPRKTRKKVPLRGYDPNPKSPLD